MRPPPYGCRVWSTGPAGPGSSEHSIIRKRLATIVNTSVYYAITVHTVSAMFSICTLSADTETCKLHFMTSLQLKLLTPVRSDFKMEAACFSGTSLSAKKSKRCHNTEEHRSTS
jgi:hypothetical protein